MSGDVHLPASGILFCYAIQSLHLITLLGSSVRRQSTLHTVKSRLRKMTLEYALALLSEVSEHVWCIVEVSMLIP